MNYPLLLTPTAVDEIQLPSGVSVHIPKATPVFEPWPDDPPEDTYGNKVTLQVDGEPVFAELAILRHFQAAGWDGVWVDTFKRKYRTQYWNDCGGTTLPPDRQLLLKDIYRRAGTEKGCWDVYCWKADAVIFAESKRRSRDKVRETQSRWLESALDTGLSLESFLIVEWSVA